MLYQRAIRNLWTRMCSSLFQPIYKISQIGSYGPGRDEKKTYFKPPPHILETEINLFDL